LCTDFAKFTWKNTDFANWQSTNLRSLSFRDYGVNHGMWRKGDIVVPDGNNSPRWRARRIP
jgi:hypothetical protein